MLKSVIAFRIQYSSVLGCICGVGCGVGCIFFRASTIRAKTAALDVVTNGGYTLTTAANLVNYWKSPTPVTNKVETIFEIGIEYQHLFKSFGGEKIQLVESLNENSTWIEAMKDLIQTKISR